NSGIIAISKVIDLTLYIAIIIYLLGRIDIDTDIDFEVDSTRTALKCSTIDTWSQDPPRTWGPYTGLRDLPWSAVAFPTLEAGRGGDGVHLLG
ncbi:hypothetical protein OC842_007663, partial [Tilletia horrida]